jgi:hypothetical protein
MLEQQDLQAIGVLLDQKLKVQSEQFDEKLGEVLSAVNDGFTEMQGQFNELKGEVAKRPTKDEVFGWADRRIVDLEIGKERHDYLHIDELDKLPPPAEINRTLIERGFKQKLT